MAKYTIAVLVGSLRRESLNRSLAEALAKMAPDDFELKQLRIDELPHYNQDDDANPPAAARRLKTELKAADGVIFVTPEYNRSIPGALKNAIDHASRPYGQNAFEGKPAGVIGVSVGAIGTAVAQSHLRTVLGYLDMPTLGQPEAYITAREGFFEADGQVTPKSREFVQEWLDRYVEWVKAHGGRAEARKAA